MMKDRSYLVFVIASVLACIPLTFYYSFTNAYLNDIGVVNAAGKMTLGQMSEVALMLLMPVVFRLLSVRGILLAGLLAWTIRYVLLAYGDPGPGVWIFWRSAAHLLRLLLRDGQPTPTRRRQRTCAAAAGFIVRDLWRQHADWVAALGQRARYFTTTTGPPSSATGLASGSARRDVCDHCCSCCSSSGARGGSTARAQPEQPAESA